MKTTSSKSLIKEASQNALKRIELIKSKITALHYACKDLRSNNYKEPVIKNDFSAIHGVLFAELNDAYRDLFMFCAVSADKDMLILAKKEALDHYLKENCYIMGYLGFDSQGSHSANLEKQFRQEIKYLEE